MRVHPMPGDSPVVVELMKQVDDKWNSFISLRKQAEQADKEHGLLRAALRLEMEGLVLGSVITRQTGTTTFITGTLEVGADAPYLFLRLTDKAGNVSKRRLKFDEGALFTVDSLPTAKI